MVARNQASTVILFLALLACPVLNECIKKVYTTDKLVPATITRLGSDCEICYIEDQKTILCNPLIETV